MKERRRKKQSRAKMLSALASSLPYLLTLSLAHAHLRDCLLKEALFIFGSSGGILGHATLLLVIRFFLPDWLNVGLSLVFPLWNSFATTNCVCNLNEGGSTYNFLILKKTPQLPQQVSSLLFPWYILFTQEGTEVLIQYQSTLFLDRICSSHLGMQHNS